jgi:hypothetical protein
MERLRSSAGRQSGRECWSQSDRRKMRRWPALPELFARRRLARKLYEDALTAICSLQAALWNGQTNIEKVRTRSFLKMT